MLIKLNFRCENTVLWDHRSFQSAKTTFLNSILIPNPMKRTINYVEILRSSIVFLVKVVHSKNLTSNDVQNRCHWILRLGHSKHLISSNSFTLDGRILSTNEPVPTIVTCKCFRCARFDTIFNISRYDSSSMKL